MNHIVLMGRLTRDPELRHTPTGTAVANFTLAVDRVFGGEDKKTDFIDIVAWKGTAEFISKHFTKGRAMALEGSLQIREWTDKDGNKRRNAEVVADRVYFADSKSPTSEGKDTPTYTKVSQSEYADFGSLYDDEDFPWE